MPMPCIASLTPYTADLCRIVAKTSLLPDPDTVRVLNRAMFPTARARKAHPRFSFIEKDGTQVGMYDDNMTPTWAILWAHGIKLGKRPGWGFAHVWQAADDMNAYTHIANLVMLPECFTGLTDKQGPLAPYLQWHARTKYGWTPDAASVPVAKPVGYDDITWNYLKPIDNPEEFVAKQISSLDNNRMRKMKQVSGWQYSNAVHP